tara:strand:- start:152 stop:574 length:423 start_codon:yes stop_codon:yes gene_type:complete
VLNLQNNAFSVKYRQYLGFYMIILLSSLYIIYGFLFLYSYVKDIGLLRYLYAKKNINILLTIELIFIVIASFIVFTNQPTNWIVGIIMLFHVFGVIWIISNPDSYYSMAKDPSIDIDSLEVATAMIIIGMGVFVYFSRII